MTGVLTQHNDLSRTGANLNETILATSNVHTGSFGKLHSYPVTGQVGAAAVRRAQAISGKNVVYIATEANNVYAYNADSPWDLIWSRTTIETPWMSASTCVNTQPLIGISSTPVIDPSTNTIYLTAKRNANGTFKYLLHALDLTTGADKPGSPIDMGLDANGQPLSVNGSRRRHEQRQDRVRSDQAPEPRRADAVPGRVDGGIRVALRSEQLSRVGPALRHDVVADPAADPLHDQPQHGARWPVAGGRRIHGRCIR